MPRTVVDHLYSQPPMMTAVVALYNASDYLPGFMASMDRQTISSKHVEVIVIDDCSTDDSLELVEAWARQRGNVKVLQNDENSGPGATRNLGYDQARGAWVTSVDPDDFIARDYFERVRNFVVAEGNDGVHMVTTRVVPFNERLGLASFDHPLDYKYRAGDQTVSLKNEPRAIQLGATAFVRTERLQAAGIRFDERVKPTFEDAHMLSRYLLIEDNPKVGLLSSATYFYRNRFTKNSLVNSGWKQRAKYVDEVDFGYITLLEEAKQTYGTVPRWLENLIIYQLSSQFTEAIKPRGLNAWVWRDNELAKGFLVRLTHIMSLISVEALEEFSIRELPPILRGALLAHFYGNEPARGFVYRDDAESVRIYTGGHPSVVLSSAELANVTSIRACYVFGKILAYESLVVEASKDTVDLDGAFREFDSPVDVNHGLTTPMPSKRTLAQRLTGDELSATSARSFLSMYKDVLRSPRNRGIPHPQVALGKKVVDKFPVLARRLTLKTALKAGAFLPQSISADDKYKDAWLIVDRMSGANDNAEHFYRYLRSIDAPVNAFFMIGRETDDYKRLKADGFRILPHDVLSVARAINQAQVIIASDWAAEDLSFVWNLRRSSASVPLVFLQHGIIQNDISHWMNGLNISMMITTLRDETEYLTNDDSPFNFKRGEVVRAGLARFDRLRELVEKHKESSQDSPLRIVMMPTWRNSVRDRLRELHGPAKSEAFKQTRIFDGWNSLLNDDRIVELIESGDIQVSFVSHPNLVEYLPDYEFPTQVKRVDIRATDFQDLLARADLYITDYSSAVSDAVVAQNDVAYYQFDRDEFYGGEQSMNSGWFDFDRDAYGPVFESQADIVEWIADRARRGVAHDDVYAQRREAMRDEVPCNSCESTYQEIQARFGGER